MGELMVLEMDAFSLWMEARDIVLPTAFDYKLQDDALWYRTRLYEWISAAMQYLYHLRTWCSMGLHGAFDILLWGNSQGLRGRCLWIRTNNEGKTRVKRVFWRNRSPWTQVFLTNNARTVSPLFPLYHETHKFAIFSLKFVPHHHSWTRVASVLFIKIQWAFSLHLFLNNNNRMDRIELGA